MPRGNRFIQPGALHHMSSRFVGQQFFIEGEEERAFYLHLLDRHITRSDWRCFSYAVMSNHVHLGVLAGNDPLASWIGKMHETFATWINGRRKRKGQIFMRGPTAWEIADQHERVTQLITYIHRNPVRAGVIAHPRDNDWTSHRAYVGLASAPRWLDVELGLAHAGISAEELDAVAGTTKYDPKEKRPRKRRRDRRRSE